MGNIYLNGSDEMAGTYKLKRDLNNMDAVSYTHLDVYKRQHV